MNKIIEFVCMDESLAPYFKCPFCRIEQLLPGYRFCPICGHNLEGYIYEEVKEKCF